MTPVDSHFDEALAKLNHLDSIRERLLLRAELLPADLAFVRDPQSHWRIKVAVPSICACRNRAIQSVNLPGNIFSR